MKKLITIIVCSYAMAGNAQVVDTLSFGDEIHLNLNLSNLSNVINNLQSNMIELLGEDSTNVTDTISSSILELQAAVDSLINANQSSAFQCGQKIEYQGYYYSTIKMGEKCWFAENLRFLPFVSEPSDVSTVDARIYVHGSSLSTVSSAKQSSSYAKFGALYNFAAVNSGSICPSGWSVPSENDWDVLEEQLGVDWLIAGIMLKGHYSNSWTGPNTQGFSALPGGRLDGYYGTFDGVGSLGWFWTSTNNGEPRYRVIYDNNNQLFSAGTPYGSGFSVRCIQD